MGPIALPHERDEYDGYKEIEKLANLFDEVSDRDEDDDDDEDAAEKDEGDDEEE